jgi:hypothetical protein
VEIDGKKFPSPCGKINVLQKDALDMDKVIVGDLTVSIPLRGNVLQKWQSSRLMTSYNLTRCFHPLAGKCASKV